MHLIEEVIGLLSGLNLVRVDRASLVNLDRPVFNILVSRPGRKDSPTMALLCADGPGPGPGSDAPTKSEFSPPTLALNLDEPESLAELDESSPCVLPFTTGLYLQFQDPAWWEHCRPFIDVASNLRVVSLTNGSSQVPSLESGANRPIHLTLDSDSLRISRSVDSMEFSVSLRMQSRGRPIRRSSAPWSLRQVVAGRLTKLQVQPYEVIVSYERPCASSMWILVNHHERRGDEVYLIICKSDLRDC